MVDVPAFRIDSLPVTNLEFRRFVDSGAYENPRYWRAEDWCWKETEKKHHPLSWFRRFGAWFHRAMFDTFALDDVAAWPVSVSLAEARAYAAWRGKRLPTEAEYHRAAFYGPDGRESNFPWGNTAPGRGTVISTSTPGLPCRWDRGQPERAAGVCWNWPAMAGN